MNQHEITTKDEHIAVALGYDEGTHGYWLQIQNLEPAVPPSTNHGDFFLFHNVNDVPGEVMTLPLLERTLSRFNIALPRELAAKLIEDSEFDNYERHLEARGGLRAVEEYQHFCERVAGGEFQPVGLPPIDWI